MTDIRQNMSDAEIRNLFNSTEDSALGGVPPNTFAPPFGVVVVDAWTSDGSGGYYYDLVHNRGRALVLFVIYDNVANEMITAHQKPPKPLTGSETTTLRITLGRTYAADRIEIGFL